MPVTQYVGSRYVPIFADPAEWSSTKTYEPLTIVLHQGNSFTSRQFVPVGIDINNTDFWAQTGNYDAQVENYRNETLACIASLATKITNFKTVGKMQENHLSLQDGMVCHTLGFRSEGIGSAYYVIESSGDADNMTVIQCGTKFARLLIQDVITPEMLGSYGDDIHNDSVCLLKALDISCTKGVPLVLHADYTYKVNSTYQNLTNNLNTLSIVGNNATIHYDNSESYAGASHAFIFINSDVIVESCTFVTETNQTGAGAHGQTITGMSKLTCFNIRNKHSIYIENCCFVGFDTAITGSIATGGSPLGNGCDITIVESSIKNTLYGIGGYANTALVSGCTFTINEKAEHGEHCIYILGDDCKSVYIYNSTFYGNDKIVSCAQVYHTSVMTETTFTIGNCTFYGIGFVTSDSHTRTIISDCVFNTPFDANANRIQPFKLEGDNEIVGCIIEMTDYMLFYGNVFRNCTIAAKKLNNSRLSGIFYDCTIRDFALGVARAYRCLFTNTNTITGNYLISGRITNDTNVVSCLVDCVWDAENSEALNIFYNSQNYTEICYIVNLTVLNPTATYATTSNQKVFYSNVTKITPVWS